MLCVCVFVYVYVAFEHALIALIQLVVVHIYSLAARIHLN